LYSKALDLFCGLGGWTAGAHRTERIRVRAALNHNEIAVRSHSTIHADVAHFCQDAAEFNFNVLRDELGGEMLLASPSCRDFSTAGNPARKGTGGNGKIDLDKLRTMRTQERNTSWAVVSAVEALEPHTALVENVTEFVDVWPLFPAWQLAMESLGYYVRIHRLNAMDFGGATDRERVFITLRRSAPLDLVPNLPGVSPRTIASCLDDDEHPENRWVPVAKRAARTRDLIQTKQRESGLSRGVVNNVGDGVRMRPLDDVAPTVTRKTGSQLHIVDGDRSRIVNPMELARIMGWKDGEVSLPPQRGLAGELIGNAIPLELAYNVCAQAVA
jgi:DNA (cytosine-5)-methyltransferase 1